MLRDLPLPSCMRRERGHFMEECTSSDQMGYHGVDPVIAGQTDRVKPAASPLALAGGDKAGLEFGGPADCGRVVLQYDRGYQASEGD